MNKPYSIDSDGKVTFSEEALELIDRIKSQGGKSDKRKKKLIN